MKSFKSFLLEKESCDFINLKQLKTIEKKLDSTFKKYDIDFDFTRHFADRMNDDRNNPCIKLSELGKIFTKIYKNRGRKIKTAKDFEAVIKDFSSDLNIPIAVHYNNKQDEFEVVLKTIMRKKNFKTPNKVLDYK